MSPIAGMPLKDAFNTDSKEGLELASNMNQTIDLPGKGS